MLLSGRFQIGAYHTERDGFSTWPDRLSTKDSACPHRQHAHVTLLAAVVGNLTG